MTPKQQIVARLQDLDREKQALVKLLRQIEEDEAREAEARRSKVKGR